MEPQSIIDEVFNNPDSDISTEDFQAALEAQWDKAEEPKTPQMPQDGKRGIELPWSG